MTVPTPTAVAVHWMVTELPAVIVMGETGFWFVKVRMVEFVVTVGVTVPVAVPMFFMVIRTVDMSPLVKIRFVKVAMLPDGPLVITA